MNATIIRALREYQLELMAISREYWNDSINTREYHDKQDSAMQRCKLKIEIALEEDDSDEAYHYPRYTAEERERLKL